MGFENLYSPNQICYHHWIPRIMTKIIIQASANKSVYMNHSLLMHLMNISLLSITLP